MLLKNNKAWAIYRKEDKDIVERIFETRKEADAYFTKVTRDIFRSFEANRKLISQFRKRYKIIRIKIKTN